MSLMSLDNQEGHLDQLKAKAAILVDTPRNYLELNVRGLAAT